jgi:hypothetical protein
MAALVAVAGGRVPVAFVVKLDITVAATVLATIVVAVEAVVAVVGRFAAAFDGKATLAICIGTSSKKGSSKHLGAVWNRACSLYGKQARPEPIRLENKE